MVAPEVAQELSQWMISQGVPDQPLNVPAMLEGDVGQRFRGWNLVTSVAIPNKDSTQAGGGRSDFIGSGANHAVTDDDRYKIVFMYRGLGVARVLQIQAVEAFRPYDIHGTVVRGFLHYGALRTVNALVITQSFSKSD